jgi:hypothetical protein
MYYKKRYELNNVLECLDKNKNNRVLNCSFFVPALLNQCVLKKDEYLIGCVILILSHSIKIKVGI